MQHYILNLRAYNGLIWTFLLHVLKTKMSPRSDSFKKKSKRRCPGGLASVVRRTQMQRTLLQHPGFNFPVLSSLWPSFLPLSNVLIKQTCFR